MRKNGLTADEVLQEYGLEEYQGALPETLADKLAAFNDAGGEISRSSGKVKDFAANGTGLTHFALVASMATIASVLMGF